MLNKLLSLVVPAWARAALLAAAGASLFFLGVLHGTTTEGQKHLDYLAAQARQTAVVVAKQVQIVHEVEVQYRDRIRTIYATGEKNVDAVPQLVTAADNQQCTINAGFVRLYDAAWAGSVAAPAAESDREPAAVSLADVAATDAENAASCHAWREQALGLRDFYQRLRALNPSASAESSDPP
jgi:hypothetical protein